MSRQRTILRFAMGEELALRIDYETGENGYTVASIPGVPGVHSQGRNRDEARANVLDALRTMLLPEDDRPDSADSESFRLIFAA